MKWKLVIGGCVSTHRVTRHARLFQDCWFEIKRKTRNYEKCNDRSTIMAFYRRLMSSCCVIPPADLDNTPYHLCKTDQNECNICNTDTSIKRFGSYNTLETQKSICPVRKSPTVRLISKTKGLIITDPNRTTN